MGFPKTSKDPLSEAAGRTAGFLVLLFYFLLLCYYLSSFRLSQAIVDEVGSISLFLGTLESLLTAKTAAGVQAGMANTRTLFLIAVVGFNVFLNFSGLAFVIDQVALLPYALFDRWVFKGYYGL